MIMHAVKSLVLLMIMHAVKSLVLLKIMHAVKSLVPNQVSTTPRLSRKRLPRHKDLLRLPLLLSSGSEHQLNRMP